MILGSTAMEIKFKAMQYKDSAPFGHQNILVLKAASFAAEAHAYQKRKTSQQPYINHLLRVSHQVAEAGLSEYAIAAAILHDVVEDTNTGFEDLTEQFPPRVVELVRLLTQWWPDDAPEELKRTEIPKYYKAILKDPDAIVIKLFDRADNLKDMAQTIAAAPKWAERYLRKSLKEMAPLLLVSPNIKARQACELALTQLSNAVEKYQNPQ